MPVRIPPHRPALTGLGLLTAGILLLLPACQRTSPVAQALAQNRLLAGNGVEPSSLDPHLNTGSAESFIISALFQPLIDVNETATGFLPAAALSWTISPDGLVYTFHLDPAARWSNGDPVTAEDWVLSLHRFLTPTLGAELAIMAYDIVGAEDFNHGQLTDPTALGITAPDAHTLVLTLRTPNVDFLGRLSAYPWLPVHIPSVTAAGGMTRPDSDFTKPGKLISNGPYQLTAWRPNQYVEVTRNPYYPGPVRLDSIRFFAMENIETEERAFRTRQLHFTSGVPAFKVAVYRAAHDPTLHVNRRVGTNYLTLNTRRPPFDDARVRRAFALAIDRQQLVDSVQRNGAPPAYTLVGPVPGIHTPTHVLTESVADARRLLAAAGYPDGAGFPPVEYLFNTNDGNRAIAEALQQMWRTGLQVDVTLRNEEWKVFLDTRNKGDYQIARSGWYPWTPEPIGLYELLTTDAGTNDTGWGNPRFDAEFQAARRELAIAARSAHYDQLDRILLDEMPIIPLSYTVISHLVHPQVEGWDFNLLDSTPWQRVGFSAGP